jgi:hypothetical protein
MKALLIVYFCLVGDICNKYTTSSWSFYVESCDKEYIIDLVENRLETQSTIKTEVVDYVCIRIDENKTVH